MSELIGISSKMQISSPLFMHILYKGHGKCCNSSKEGIIIPKPSISAENCIGVQKGMVPNKANKTLEIKTKKDLNNLFIIQYTWRRTMKNQLKMPITKQIQFVSSFRNFKYCTVDNSKLNGIQNLKKTNNIAISVYIVLYQLTKPQNPKWNKILIHYCAMASTETDMKIEGGLIDYKWTILQIQKDHQKKIK